VKENAMKILMSIINMRSAQKRVKSPNKESWNEVTMEKQNLVFAALLRHQASGIPVSNTLTYFFTGKTQLQNAFSSLYTLYARALTVHIIRQSASSH